MEILIIVGIIAVVSFIFWIADIYNKSKDYDELKPRIDKLDQDKIDLKIGENELSERIKKWEKRVAKDKIVIKRLAEEKSSGFPWLADAYADYFNLMHEEEAKRLYFKSHPAVKSAERVQQIGRERRTVEKKLRIAQGIIKYYQNLFPFIEDWLDERQDELLKMVLNKNVGEPIEKVQAYWEKGIDPTKLYISKEEYQKLSTTKRNQLALDRYWSRSKNRIEAGRAYERYIGYVYEKNGWNVYYQGILEGREDLGRDLVCNKEKETLVIQCKRWSLIKKKVIRENHINQLFGTAVKYRIDHPKEDVIPVLYTTTEVSDMGKKFAKALGVKIYEKFPFEEYESIKCNVSHKNKEKIYHLPFDQQYDKTFIEEERLEKFVKTVAEAEKLGFRRAYRWRGNKEK